MLRFAYRLFPRAYRFTSRAVSERTPIPVIFKVIQMVDQSKIRVGVIGCGSVGKIHAQAIRDCPMTELAGVYDINADHARRLSEAMASVSVESLDDLLSLHDLQAVTIATPDDQHVLPTTEAIRRGLHVFCEKPLAQSLDDARRLADLANQHKVQLGVDYNRRFGFGYQKARTIISQPARKPLRQIACHVIDGVPLAVAHQPYAMLHSLVSHHLDLLRWFGGEPATIHATMRGPSSEHPHEISLIMNHVTGMTSALSACWRPEQTRTSERMQLVSDDCVIAVDDVQQRLSVWEDDPDERQVFQPSLFCFGNRFYDTVHAHLCTFLEAIANAKPVPVSAADGIATLQMTEAAIQSHRTRREVNVNVDALTA